jgi:hypothetical protein
LAALLATTLLKKQGLAVLALANATSLNNN